MIVLTRRSFVLAAAALPLAACTDPEKKWRPRVQALADKLAARVEGDVADVRKGMPEAAAKLAKSLPADPGQNLEELQRLVGAARNGSPSLVASKITTLAFADESGTVLRSEANPDLLATKSVFATFGELKKALGAPSLVEVWGEMSELRVAKTGADLQWVFAQAVKGDDKVRGLLVGALSLCGYARFLEDQAKREAREQVKQAGEKNEPVVYVFVHKGKVAVGAPLTPEINTQKAAELDVLAKLPFEGQVDIANRPFFVSSRKVPALGDDAAVTVLLSGV